MYIQLVLRAYAIKEILCFMGETVLFRIEHHC